MTDEKGEVFFVGKDVAKVLWQSLTRTGKSYKNTKHKNTLSIFENASKWSNKLYII